VYIYRNYEELVVNVAAKYATSRKVTGLIAVEVIGFFNRPNPSSRTMAL
jgi:hypothetical protein